MAGEEAGDDVFASHAAFAALSSGPAIMRGDRVGRACSGEVRSGSGAAGKSAATPAATLSSIEALRARMRR
jgi:hypothetical protein